MKVPAIRRPQGKSAYLAIGSIALVAVLAILLGSIYKPQIQTMLISGEHRTIELVGDRFLLPHTSTVKVAGVDVGRVTEVERTDAGTAEARVKVEDEIFELAGSEPTAALRPNILLAGQYYIEVIPGGDLSQDWTEDIPLERTRLPEELDEITNSLQPDALDGAQTAIEQFDETLAQGGTEAVQDVLETAPDTFDPGADVIASLRGENPRSDLPELVRGLESTSETLTRNDGQLDAILADLGETSSALADTAEPVAQTLEALPANLERTESGMASLQGSLANLRETADPARPAVQELETFLDDADPVLANARPVVNDLRFALKDTRPLVDDLVPASQQGTEVLNNLSGPVLDRLTGPIAEAVLSGYQGDGPYENTSGDNPLFQETAYALSGLNAAGAYADAQGNAVAFHPGPGPGTLAGAGPLSLEDMFQHIFHDEGPENEGELGSDEDGEED